MICAVYDTNVLVSALITKHPDSSTTKVLEFLYEGHIIPIYNEEILKEYQEVLSRPKFPINPNAITGLISFIQHNGIQAEREPVDNWKLPDESDRVFYEVSLSQEDSYLVTGNKKHFPITPKVVSPAEMVAIVEAMN